MAYLSKSTTTKKKWFYPLQDRVNSYLATRYDWYQHQYQDVCKDRVYEGYIVKHKDTGRIQFLLFQLRRLKDDFTVFIDEEDGVVNRVAGSSAQE